MRRVVSLIAIAALVLAAGCAKKDEHSATADLRNAGHQIDHAAGDVSHNADVRHAEADLHNAVRDAGHDLHKAETEARNAVHTLQAHFHHAHHPSDQPAPDHTNG
jgi:Spy/CpxP family protein refolding chaperone